MQKRYTTWNEYLRKILVKKYLRSLLMRDLIVPIGMGRWRMEAVHFVRFLGQVI